MGTSRDSVSQGARSELEKGWTGAVTDMVVLEALGNGQPPAPLPTRTTWVWKETRPLKGTSL